MAVSAIVAAVSTGFTAISGGALLGGFLVAGGVGTVFTHFLVSTAMGAALNALTPKPKIGGAGAGGYSINGANGSSLAHQIIYGETRVGGVRVYDAATGGNNEFLHRILAFAGHEVDSYQQIYLNDEVVTIDGSGNVTSPSRYDGFVRIKTYSGTTTQTADADLISETSGLTDGQWTSNHRLQGIAYIYVRFKYNADAFPNGIPSVSAVIRGKKVYDPRSGLTVWNNNPALCIRDYLTSEYGLNQPSDRIDDALVIASANISDQTTEGQSRYSCNGAFTTDSEPAEVITNLLTSMGGLLWYGQGKWRMKASAWATPAVTFDEDDLRSGISLSTRHSRRDNFNSVKGTFRGAESDWQPADYPEVTDPAFLTADNGLVNVLDFTLPFTSSSLTAQRVARIALNRNREQLTFSASFGMRAFQVQVGDFIYINNTRFGWTNKAFEVTEWTFGLTDGLDIQVRMTLREISEGVFTGVDGAAFEQNNTTLPDPFINVAPINLEAVKAAFIATDGTYVNNINVSWEPPNAAFVSHYEIEWRKTSVTEYTGATTSSTEFTIFSVEDDETYAIRVRAVNALGVRGPFASLTFNSGPDITAPNNPSSLTAVGRFGYFNIQWVNPSDRDFDYVEVWEGETGVLGEASQIAAAYGNTFVRGNVTPGLTRFFWIRAVDASGNKSGYVGPVNATSAYVDDEDFVDGVVNLFLDQSLGAVPYGDTFPISPSDGDRFFLTTDGQLYEYNSTGSRWELLAEPGSIVASDKIVANTITGGLLATSGIITGSAQINDAVIENANIKNLAVDRIKLGLGSVTDFFSVSNAVSKTVSSYGAFESIGSTTSFTLPSNALESPQTLRISGGIATNFSASFVLSSSVQTLSFAMRVRVYNETLATYVADGPTRTIRSFSARGGAIPLTLAGSSPNITISSFYTTTFLVSTSSNSPEQVLTLNIPPDSTTIRPGDTLRLELEVRKDRNFTDISSVVSVSSVLYQVETYYR